MKTVRKFSAVILAIIVVLNLLTPPVSAGEANLKLNASSVTLRGLKQTYQLSLTAGASKKISWSSGDKKIATVSKNGLVTPKKEGSVKITASAGGEAVTCSFTVTTRGVDSGNAYATDSGDWIYYTDQHSLYRIKTNGKSQKLMANGAGGNINVIDNYVYFLRPNTKKSGSYEICRMKTNGKKGSEKVLKSGEFGSFTVAGNSIYYTEGNNNSGFKLNRMSLNGKNTKTVVKSVKGNYDIYNGRIYYTDYLKSRGIYRVKTDGSGKTEKIYSGLCFGFNLVGSKIYFTDWEDKGNVYSIKTDGKNKTKMFFGKADVYTVNDDWVYYRTGGNFYRAKLDGSKKTPLYKGDASWVESVSVVGGWIYYRDSFKIYRMKTGSDTAEDLEPSRLHQRDSDKPTMKINVKARTETAITYAVECKCGSRADNALTKFEVRDGNKRIIFQRELEIIDDLGAETTYGPETFKTDYKITKNGTYYFCIYDRYGNRQANYTVTYVKP